MSVLDMEGRQQKYYFKAHDSCPSRIEVEISDDVTNLNMYFRRINLSLAILHFAEYDRIGHPKIPTQIYCDEAKMPKQCESGIARQLRAHVDSTSYHNA